MAWQYDREGSFLSYTETNDEISLILPESATELFPPGLVATSDQSWRAIQFTEGSTPSGMRSHLTFHTDPSVILRRYIRWEKRLREWHSQSAGEGWHTHLLPHYIQFWSRVGGRGQLRWGQEMSEIESTYTVGRRWARLLCQLFLRVSGLIPSLVDDVIVYRVILTLVLIGYQFFGAQQPM